MATVSIDLHATFEKMCRSILEDHIRKNIETVREAAMQRMSDEIDLWVCATALKVFEVCSFDRAGRELRITVDTSRVFKEE